MDDFFIKHFVLNNLNIIKSNIYKVSAQNKGFFIMTVKKIKTKIHVHNNNGMRVSYHH